jgi:hypothetical protein
MEKGVIHINADLMELNNCIDRNNICCGCLEKELDVEKVKVVVLEDKVQRQHEPSIKMLVRLETMEGKLCHCGEKEKEAIVVEATPYSTPMVEAGPLPLPSIPGLDDDIESIYAEEDKENKEPLRVIVRPLVLDVQAFKNLVVVRGQSACHSKGIPSSFHPYCCCAIGPRNSSHCHGSLCCHQHLGGVEGLSGDGGPSSSSVTMV